MLKLNGRKVSIVRTLGSTHVQNLGNVKSVLDKNVVRDIDMTLTEYGVHATGTGPDRLKFEFIIPYNQCMSIQLVPSNEANNK